MYVCPSPKKEHSILFHGPGTIEKKDPGFPWNAYYNATDNCINPPIYYRKEKKKGSFFWGEWNSAPGPLSNWLMYLVDPSGLTGLEPAASALTGRCSDQLNYNPREIRDLAEIWILYLRIEYFWGARGLYVVDWWIFGPSWIWTSVDILSTNLQSVPINPSGIDPGGIACKTIGNSWSTSFPSPLPPGEVESPPPPWKRDVLNR